MMNEIKELFGNIIHFRQLLKEGDADAGTIADAINDNKYLKIYYAGDNTILKGYRTIKPFVLGKGANGQLLLRAWQENGNSDSYAGLTGRKRDRHEYHYSQSYVTADGTEDSKGGMKPGWRLFTVSGITSVLPTGQRFSIEFKNLPPYYNPNDTAMKGGIDAAVPKNAYSKLKTKGLDSPAEPDVVQQQVMGTNDDFFKPQADKFQQFYKAGKKTRDITNSEVEHLYGQNKQFAKKNPADLIVYANEKGDMVLKDKRDEASLPPESIVGNLQDLYSKLVAPNKANSSTGVANSQFLSSKSKESIAAADAKLAERRTFFK